MTSERFRQAPRLGAVPQPDGTVTFTVWAPNAELVDVELVGGATARLAPTDRGYHVVTVGDANPGDRYWYRLDGGERLADPASRHQPEGVHGPSEVVAMPTDWSDGSWKGSSLDDLVLYELHVGTFTTGGTFDAAAEHFEALAELGVTAVELMPIAAFPGARNWGYDGVFLHAAHTTYGGPHGLARMVDRAHAVGLGVILDVVYNHLGPEGNRLAEFGPYFTDTYATPWGDAVNVSEAGSDEVRRFFIESACSWIEDFHIDGLRLDAIHAIVDPTAMPFIEELAGTVHAVGADLGRDVLVIAESSDNDPHIVATATQGGLGCDAVWNDDLHHGVHVAVTGERDGYYVDYTGAADVAKVYRDRWVFDGGYSIIRGRRHGRSADDLAFARLVVCDQNHDQIGNRALGDRLDTQVGLEARKLAAAATVLGPFTPMLFMGEEYGERSPFPYFVDHQHPTLIEAVRAGRRSEFAAFDWADDVPDPAAEATFQAAVLDRSVIDRDPHRFVLALYRDLLAARRRIGPLTAICAQQVDEHGDTVVIHRWVGDDAVVVVLNFADSVAEGPLPDGDWRVDLTTADARYGGPGRPLAPWSATLFVRARGDD